ncbi:MAG: GNAT family N-acetyltransferase [Anaerolineales bacterium]|nr:GNAT family N-acetyltransferase [Anaerolineales bacterium]
MERFFKLIQTSDEIEFFHPHPFSSDEALRICNYIGSDMYFGLLQDGHIIGYGMLRGWDEGYDVPSLGIVIHPSERGKGMGEFMMLKLHETARQKGTKEIRLKVYPDNSAAIHLYKNLGYVFRGFEQDQMIGILIL